MCTFTCLQCVTHLSAALNMPLAAWAFSSAGQEERKRSSSFIMERTLEADTSAKESSNARLESWPKGINVSNSVYTLRCFQTARACQDASIVLNLNTTATVPSWSAAGRSKVLLVCERPIYLYTYYTLQQRTRSVKRNRLGATSVLKFDYHTLRGFLHLGGFISISKWTDPWIFRIFFNQIMSVDSLKTHIRGWYWKSITVYWTSVEYQLCLTSGEEVKVTAWQKRPGPSGSPLWFLCGVALHCGLSQQSFEEMSWQCTWTRIQNSQKQRCPFLKYILHYDEALWVSWIDWGLHCSQLDSEYVV